MSRVAWKADKPRETTFFEWAVERLRDCMGRLQEIVRLVDERRRDKSAPGALQQLHERIEGTGISLLAGLNAATSPEARP